MSEATSVNSKQKFMDRFADAIVNISSPMSRLSQFPFMQAIQEGFAATLPFMLFGSIFLILQSAITGALGFTIFPSLAKYTPQLLIPHQLGSGILALYATLAIGIAYAKRLELNVTNASLVVIGWFFFINFNDVSNGFGTAPFSTSGVMSAMLGSFVSIRLYHFLIKKNIVIKLPEMVPPAIGNAFTSLIPSFAVLLLAWVVRTALNFNFTEWFSGLLAPILRMGDNVWMFALNNTLSGMFWSVGIHYENMVTSVVTPMTTMFLTANQEAYAAGTALSELPHIWVFGMSNWATRCITNYPMLVLLLRSKVPGFKELGMAALVPVIFCICEPLSFGIVAMNPYMMIPLILSNLIGSFPIYFAFGTGLVNKCFTTVPWATPCTLGGIGMTGDWRAVLLIGFQLILGIIIYYPFFVAYEKDTLKKAAERQAAEQKALAAE